jgi:hypothetical protein
MTAASQCPLTPELSVSNREHAAMEVKKATGTDPLLDARVANAGGEHWEGVITPYCLRRNGAHG